MPCLMSRVCSAAGIGSSVERPFTSKEKLPGAEPLAAALAWYSCMYTTLSFSRAAFDIVLHEHQLCWYHGLPDSSF